MRTVPKMCAIYGNMRILDQKTTFHMSCAVSKYIQSVNGKRLPPTGHATTNFQYSKNLGRRDLYENIGSKHMTKNTSRAALPFVAHHSLGYARLPPPHTVDRVSQQFSTLTICPSTPTTDPSSCFTCYEGSL